MPVPTGLGAAPGGDNTVDLSWSGTAAGYRLMRAQGGCGGIFEAVVELDGSQFSFSDTPVSGGITYGYVVRGDETCESADSNCVEITPAGPCLLEPGFDGLDNRRWSRSGAIRRSRGPRWRSSFASMGARLRGGDLHPDAPRGLGLRD